MLKKYWRSELTCCGTTDTLLAWGCIVCLISKWEAAAKTPFALLRPRLLESRSLPAIVSRNCLWVLVRTSGSSTPSVTSTPASLSLQPSAYLAILVSTFSVFDTSLGLLVLFFLMKITKSYDGLSYWPLGASPPVPACFPHMQILEKTRGPGVKPCSFALGMLQGLFTLCFKNKRCDDQK